MRVGGISILNELVRNARFSLASRRVTDARSVFANASCALIRGIMSHGGKLSVLSIKGPATGLLGYLPNTSWPARNETKSFVIETPVARSSKE